VNLYDPSPGLSKFLNLRSVSVSRMIEISFDPKLAAMAGLPFYRPTQTYLLTKIIFGYV
jgi:hypothetical protein